VGRVGDLGEEARVLSEMAWTHLANDDPALSEWSKLLANWLRGRKLIK